jgi:uncharacterized repeat protein (TIGR01451 family)
MVRSHVFGACTLVATAVLLLAFQALPASAGTPPYPSVASSDLAITNLAASPTPGVMVDANSTYTIYFVNNGPDAAGNAWVKMSTPTDTTFVSANVTAGSGWSLTSSPAGGGTGDVVFTNASGPANGAAAQFQVVVKVNASAHHYTAITATASTYTTDAGTTDPVSTNNAVTVTTRAMIVADPLEPNDTSATATTISVGTTSNLIFSMDWNWTYLDNDWYKFCVAADDGGKDLKVNIKITSAYPSSPPSTWRSDLDFALFDSSVTLKAMALSGNDNETVYLHNIAASSCYYINVPYATVDYAEGFGWGRYQITIETGTSFGVGFVTGRIMSSAATPAPIPGVQIAVYDVPWVQTNSYVTGVSGSDGYFSIPAPPGIRDLYFTGNLAATNFGLPGVNVVDEYYSDQDLLANANHITVVNGATNDVGTVTMDVGAIISGHVTDGSGTPLYYAFVYAFKPSDVLKANTFTDTSGNYTLMGVPIGGAKIRFARNSYAAEFYDDQPTFGTGTTLNLSAGATMTNVNAVMTPGGTISGTVTDVNGTGLGVTLHLYSVLDSTYRRAQVTSTAGTGAYSFTYVKPGSYKIYVKPTGTGFAPEWYNDATSFAAATTVTVAEGGTTSGNNIVLGTPGGVDFNGDLRADILWHHVSNGQVWAWPMNGTTPSSQSYVGTVADTDWEVRAVADFTGDFVADLLWRNKTNGMVYLWTMNGTTPSAQTYVGTVDVAYDIVSYGDYSGDGKTDLLWRKAANGEVWAWVMNGATITNNQYVATIDPAYTIKASGDLDGNGRCDIIWHHSTTGAVWVWLTQTSGSYTENYVTTVPDLHYQIKAVADFDGNGKADILWHNNATGEVWIWLMNGAVKQSENYVGTVADLNYQIASVGDYNGDLKADMLWWNSSDGEVWIWLMNGAVRQSQNFVGTVPDTGYQIVR